MSRWLRFGFGLLLAAQVVAEIRVALRLISTASGVRIATVQQDGHSAEPVDEPVAVIVPVLNEERRLGPCLDGLVAQGPEVREILIVDGGSTDRTHDVVADAMQHDARIRWIDAAPVADGWNGKAWGLEAGLREVGSDCRWVLTIDADVRPGPDLVPSLLAHAHKERIRALSVATPQMLSGVAEAVVHPSLLATLVYRYGIPGQRVTDVEAVQANGQCFLIDQALLHQMGGFAGVKASVIEDVTLARSAIAAGEPVGFYEPADGETLIRVEMYQGWRDAWLNWTRSLPMRDRFSGSGWWLRMADATLAFGLPLPVAVACIVAGDRGGPIVKAGRTVNLALLANRFGVAAGMRRAYARTPWSYWLSPLVDPLVIVRLWQQALRRTYSWRGRPVQREIG